MAPVKTPSGGDRLVRGAKAHREGEVEGAVKPAERIGQCLGMLADRCSDPGMRKLEQQCATGAEKNRYFSIDAPRHGMRAKDARGAAGRHRADKCELALEIGFGDDG